MGVSRTLSILPVGMSVESTGVYWFALSSSSWS